MDADVEASELLPFRPGDERRVYMNRNIENVINSMPEAQATGSRANSNEDQLDMSRQDSRSMMKKQAVIADKMLSINTTKRNIRNIYYNTNEEQS